MPESSAVDVCRIPKPSVQTPKSRHPNPDCCKASRETNKRGMAIFLGSSSVGCAFQGLCGTGPPKAATQMSCSLHDGHLLEIKSCPPSRKVITDAQNIQVVKLHATTVTTAENANAIMHYIQTPSIQVGEVSIAKTLCHTTAAPVRIAEPASSLLHPIPHTVG